MLTHPHDLAQRSASKIPSYFFVLYFVMAVNVVERVTGGIQEREIKEDEDGDDLCLWSYTCVGRKRVSSEWVSEVFDTRSWRLGMLILLFDCCCYCVCMMMMIVVAVILFKMKIYAVASHSIRHGIWWLLCSFTFVFGSTRSANSSCPIILRSKKEFAIQIHVHERWEDQAIGLERSISW